MMKKNRCGINIFIIISLFFLCSCASVSKRPIQESSIAYSLYDQTSLQTRFAPVFIVEDGNRDFNRIGSPVVRIEAGKESVVIDPDVATYYLSTRSFKTEKGSFTNLIYRVHFQKIPFSIIPFHLGYGENVGLLSVVTLNDRKEPVLYTLLHTCGCYLAFIPTSNLPEAHLPIGWKKGRQDVFSENLPSYISFSQNGTDELLYVQLRTKKHRVKNVWVSGLEELKGFKLIKPDLQSFSSLENLESENGTYTSFFETSGLRKGYVKGSQKIWERLFISWWALDWRVGEDKKLGIDTSDGNVFYTSLKPWAREESDLRDFPRFLKYWGWRL